MALSADTIYRSRGRNTMALTTTNAVVFYKGSLVGVSTSSGLAVLWADTANYQFAGIALRGVTGDGSNEVEVDTSGPILERVAVTGVSAQGNVWDLVYASDDGTFDISAVHGSNVDPIGMIVRWHSSTTCDVMLFTPGEHRAGPA